MHAFFSGPEGIEQRIGTLWMFALVHHDDAEREWAHDRKSDVGRLDKAWDEATAKGWTVVSMKDDWKTIFPPLK